MNHAHIWRKSIPAEATSNCKTIWILVFKNCLLRWDWTSIGRKARRPVWLKQHEQEGIRSWVGSRGQIIWDLVDLGILFWMWSNTTEGFWVKEWQDLVPIFTPVLQMGNLRLREYVAQCHTAGKSQGGWAQVKSVWIWSCAPDRLAYCLLPRTTSYLGYIKFSFCRKTYGIFYGSTKNKIEHFMLWK